MAILIPNAQQSVATTTKATVSDTDITNSTPSIESAAEPVAEQVIQYPVALILSIDKERVLLLEPNQAQLLTLNIADAQSRMTGDYLMVRKAAEAVADDEDAIGVIKSAADKQLNAQKEFGFRWFIPELLK